MLVWLALTLAAHADQKIDLAPHYAPKPTVNGEARYDIVERDGIRYKKFGNLYVIDGQPLSKGSIESGRCFDQTGAPTHEDLVKAETKLTDSDVKAFGGLIQQTSSSRCDNFVSAVKALPALGLGFSKTVTGKDGIPKEFRLFNTDFGRNLNFSGQF